MAKKTERIYIRTTKLIKDIINTLATDEVNATDLVEKAIYNTYYEQYIDVKQKNRNGF